jgi:hypothetical protein
VCRCVIECVGAHRPFGPEPLACDWTSAPAPVYGRESCLVDVGCPSPEPETHWRTAPVQPPLGRGRDEGTEKLLGRRDPQSGLCTRRHRDERTSRSVWCSPGGAPANGTEDRTRCQRRTTLSLNHSGKNGKNPLLGRVCLLTTGGLIRVILRVRPPAEIRHAYFEGVSDLWISSQTDTRNSYRLMKSPITKSCMRSVFEKQIVRRTNRLIRVRRLMCLLSIFCVCAFPTVCCSASTCRS